MKDPKWKMKVGRRNVTRERGKKEREQKRRTNPRVYLGSILTQAVFLVLRFRSGTPCGRLHSLDAYTSRGEYSDEVVKETEVMAVEVEAVDFPEVYDDRKDEATRCDVMT